MAKEETLPSGNKLVVGEISWEQVCELRAYICETLKSLTVKGETFEAIISGVKEIPYYLENQNFRNMFFGFADRSGIKGKDGKLENLSPAYFNKREHWQDYYPACKAILEYNLTPFLDGLKNMFPNWIALANKMIELNKSKTSG